MSGKLNLDHHLVEEARVTAKEITEEVDRFISTRSTVSIERTVLRLFGVDGVHDDIPLPNIVVDGLLYAGVLHRGVMQSSRQARLHKRLRSWLLKKSFL
jgi:beta-lysine 5,6-aminomutase alpha subunit